MSANNYKQMASASQNTEKIFDVTVPSGFVWKLREPPLKAFILAGKLPAALTAKMADIHSRFHGDFEGAQRASIEELTGEEVLANLEFARDMLLLSAVEPKIAIKPANEDEIAPEEILPEDLEFLIGWVMAGGKSGEDLSTFRPE